MVLIENEGALFRGFGRSFPQEVWNPGSGWKPYKGKVPKPEEWGYVIDEAEADALVAELNAHHQGRRMADQMK